MKMELSQQKIYELTGSYVALIYIELLLRKRFYCKLNGNFSGLSTLNFFPGVVQLLYNEYKNSKYIKRYQNLRSYKKLAKGIFSHLEEMGIFKLIDKEIGRFMQECPMLVVPLDFHRGVIK